MPPRSNLVSSGVPRLVNFALLLWPRRRTSSSGAMRYRHCILGFRALFALLAALIICSVSLYFANIFLWFNRENPAWFKETFFVYWIVHSIIQVVVAWVFFSRLNFFPLKPRSPILLGISAFANYLLCSWALFRLFQEKARFSCRVVKWLINIGYPCMILPYFLRAYRLTKLFDESNTHNQGRLRSFSIDNDEDTNRKRLLSRENGDSFSIRSDSVEIYSEESNSRVTQSRLLVYLAFMLSPFIILAIVDSFLNVGMLPIFGSELSCSTYQLVSDTTARIFWIVVHYSESFALLFFVRKLRNVWDEFNIVWELKLTCLSCFVNALALSFFIGAKTRNSFLNEESLVYITRGVFLFSISIVWPLYKTYTPNMLNFPDRLMVGSLREVLHVSQFPPIRLLILISYLPFSNHRTSPAFHTFSSSALV